MKQSVLQLEKIAIEVSGKRVLDNFSLEIKEGQIVALIGPNGSGKSSLANLIMGNPDYVLVEGKIQYLGKDLSNLDIDERARAGVFVAWQNPIVIPGVTIFNLCKSITNYQGSLVELKNKIEELLVKVGLPKEYVSRSVNDGFSGGEKKRLELLQMLLLPNKLVVMDEVDSGLDADGVEMLGDVIEELRKKKVSVLLITHNSQLNEKLKVDFVCKTTI